MDPLLLEFAESLVHEPGVRALVLVPLSLSKATARAISSEVSPPTARGEMKPSKSVEVRSWKWIVFSTATS